MIEFIKMLAKEAGSLCLERNQEEVAMTFKSQKDLVTEVDKEVEALIVSSVLSRFPDHDIFGEETGRTNKGSRFCWVIDPIDGTTSYFHKQPFYSVSIALQERGETIAGVVYAPVLEELFWAEKGAGAFLNDQGITVSSTRKLINSVMATGFACVRAGLEKNNLHYLNSILPNIRDVRRYGSAALDLCYVACGRVDGFWEMNLNLYDIAAGVLIAKEAGARVCDFNGGMNFPAEGIVAANGWINDDLLALLS